MTLITLFLLAIGCVALGLGLAWLAVEGGARVGRWNDRRRARAIAEHTPEYWG